MKTVGDSYSKLLSIVILTLVALVALGIPMCGQEAAITVGDVRITGVVDDWSHHHLVFSNPGTADEAMRNGTYEQWLKVTKDPRYIMHQLKRGLPAQGPAAEAVAARQSQAAAIASTRPEPIPPPAAKPKPPKTTVKKDWSMGLGGYLGAGQYPAKYSFYTNTASCGDFVVYPTGAIGSGTQATIVAYNNIYATACGTAVTRPAIAWAYNTQNAGTGTGGTSNLSPVLSLDGTQVAYIQYVGTTSNLVLLKPSSTSGGTVILPAAITYQTNANYRGCTAPCYTTMALSSNDTNSAPYYDYVNDVLYVGDVGGVLHKFQNIFLSGQPGEITGGGTASGWPQTMASGVTLTSPVYDPTSGDVFVGSSGGYLYRILAAGGSSNLVASAHLTATGSTGIVDAPLLDSMPATPKVYVFTGDTDEVFQFATNFASANGGITEALGSSATTTNVYAGAFDNLHYDIAGGAGGNLYVCGYHNTGTTPRLYQIVMNSSFNGTVNTIGNDPASNAAACSPVTEFLGSKANTTLTTTITNATTSLTVGSNTSIVANDYIQIDSEIMKVSSVSGGTTVVVTRGGTGALGTATAAHNSGAAVQDIQDWIYLSVSANGNETGCGTACIYNYSVTTGAPGTATAGFAATGGTSGIIIDNSVTAATTAGASQIYYSTRGNAACAGNGTTGATTGGCAVQASQSAP